MQLENEQYTKDGEFAPVTVHTPTLYHGELIEHEQEAMSSHRKQRQRRHRDVPPLDLSSFASDSEEERTVQRNKKKGRRTKSEV